MLRVLDEPWRELRWGKVQEDRQYVQEYKPAKDEIKYLRVLLYGPVGHGKSSLINSVSNVFRGRISNLALTATLSNKSFTTTYQTHKFIEGQGSSKTFYPVVFIDMMGLEEGDNRGVHENDIKLALQGHVKEGHKFNPVSLLTQHDPGYNPTPSADDKVHVLVCVISANSPQIKPSILQKMKNVRETASELGIPQIAIMTNIDGLCDEIEKDLKNVYMSKRLRKKMRDFSAAVGIPMNCIFPVKNYSHEINLKDDIDTLTLSALRTIIDFGDDFIEKI
ncbi:interferon-induced protein 44 [Fundulus heteroclitus]|uniref:interferon-induced protein 44 n=1 Tax=Fundulus heteroclitus TaxID=8078 RepID=UPI00165C5A80|nr:interferon-induced protein 44 [Fundulus heteroclitus]